MVKRTNNLRFMVFSSVSDMKGLFCKMAGQA